MTYFTPGYLLPFETTGTAAIAAVVVFGVHKALKRAGWTGEDRRRAVWKIAVLMGVWFAATVAVSALGLYRTALAGTPTIQYGVVLPIVAGVLLFRYWGTLRRVVATVPQSWLVSVQFYRAEGLIFLLLYAAGLLPGVFAWPAGVGDVLVGLLAPIVAVRYTSESPHGARWVWAWNVLGLEDLIVALALGFLTSPSRFQMFALSAPNDLISAFPLVLIPVFVVPLSILLHVASLQKLRQARRAARELPGALLAAQGS